MGLQRIVRLEKLLVSNLVNSIIDMARERTYGWSPEQLARINARREARGQEAYIDKRFSDKDYAKRYIGQSESYAAKMGKGISPIAMQDNQNGIEKLSMEKEAEERTKKFREKFGPAGSMGIERGVKSSFPSILKKGVQGGIGTSLQDSLYRFTA